METRVTDLYSHRHDNREAACRHRAQVVMLSTEYGTEIASVIPHVSYFPERALAYIARARDADRLVLVLPDKVRRSAYSYFFQQFYQEFEANEISPQIEFLAVPDGTSGALTDHFLGSPTLFEKLRCAVGEASKIHIVNAVASERDQRLASALGASLDEEVPDAAAKYGTKFGSKTVFGIACVDQPHWTPGCFREPTDVIHAITTRFETCRRVCVKIDDAAMAGGIGNFYFRQPSEAGEIGANNLEVLLETSSRPFQEFWGLVSASGCIVEEFIEDADRFPSALMYISRTGIEMISCQQQVIINSHFSGFDIDPSQGLEMKLRRPVNDIAKTLKGLGYRGTAGVDFIETGSGALKALELNLRKTGVSHVVEYCDGILKKHGRARDQTTHIAYRRGVFAKSVDSRNYERNLAAVREINEQLVSRLGDGAYLINVNSLQLNGFVEYVCIGSNRHQTTDLTTAVASLFDCHPASAEPVG